MALLLLLASTTHGAVAAGSPLGYKCLTMACSWLALDAGEPSRVVGSSYSVLGAGHIAQAVQQGSNLCGHRRLLRVHVQPRGRKPPVDLNRRDLSATKLSDVRGCVTSVGLMQRTREDIEEG